MESERVEWGPGWAATKSPVFVLWSSLGPRSQARGVWRQVCGLENQGQVSSLDSKEARQARGRPQLQTHPGASCQLSASSPRSLLAQRSAGRPLPRCPAARRRDSVAQAQTQRAAAAWAGGRRELAAGPYQVPVDVRRLEVEGGVEQLFQLARDVVLLVVRHRLLLQLLQVPSDPASAAAFVPHGRRLRATAGFRRGARQRPFVARQRHEITTPRSREASCPGWKEPQLSVRDLRSSRPHFVVCSALSLGSAGHCSSDSFADGGRHLTIV